ncbi:MAG: hypothetical protein LBE38_05635 [Deltaproteobacteria bacterium]|jgi:hypothetical protein|nr:hypothetical protein [Deltaproteobacteria bacterium]
MAENSQIICKACGGNIDIIPGVTSYICPFCDTVNDIFEKPSPDLAPDQIKYVISVQVDQKHLHTFALQKMIEDDMAPDDIITTSVFLEEFIMYVPFFLTRGTFKANWTASFGFDRQEPYTAYETYYQNGRERTRRVTRYRTVTDWRPASGVAQGNFQALAYAGATLPPLGVKIAESLSPSLITPYTDVFVKDYSVEPFGKHRDDPQVLKTFDSVIRGQEYAAVAGHFQGDRQRDVNYNSKRTTNTIDPGILPIAHVVFTYLDNQYNIWADGVNFHNVYTDPLPKDTKRQGHIYLGYLPLWISLAALIGIAIYFGTFSFLSVLAPALALVYALVRKSSILGYSKKMRHASLAQKKLEEYYQTGSMSEEEAQHYRNNSAFPTRPFLSNTEHDPWFITLLCLILAAGAIIPYFFL